MPTGETPRQMLFAAAWRGEEQVVKDLINGKRVPINAVDENHVTALRFTAQYGHTDLTKFLLDRGADPNIKAHDKIDPLLSAVEQGHKEIILLLLDNGAKVNTRTNFTNAILLSREKGHSEIEQILRDHGGTESMGWLKDHGIKCAIS